MSKVAIVGSGNVAFHLAKAFLKSGNGISLLAVRDKVKASDFANLTDQITAEKDLSKHELDLVILAVSDDAIASVAGTYLFPENATIVHTSGSKSIELLNTSHITNFGVLYPLQTFSKTKEINYSELRVFIEGRDQKCLKTIRDTTANITSHISILSSQQRLQLHMAAVIANNFTNALFFIAENQLAGAGISFEVLAALIRETTEKAITNGPKVSQTGPAIRGDQEVIDLHLKNLEDQPEIQQIYDLLSNFISQKLKN